MRLVELAYCCRLFGEFTRNDTSGDELRDATGSSIDLHEPVHTKALLRLLNQWGCRQFAVEYHGEAGRMFEGILHNTAVPTVIQGGSKTNVIPGSVEITLDGRLLPGQTSDEFLQELREILGNDAEIAHVRHAPSRTEAPVDEQFDALADIIAGMDPGARAVPFIVTGVTDARHFARLGTICYGFAPVKLQPDLPFWSLFHGADERIPVEGLRVGAEAV